MTSGTRNIFNKIAGPRLSVCMDVMVTNLLSIYPYSIITHRMSICADLFAEDLNVKAGQI